MATNGYLDQADNPYDQSRMTPPPAFASASQLPVGTTSVAPDGTLQRWTGTTWEAVGSAPPLAQTFNPNSAPGPGLSNIANVVNAAKGVTGQGAAPTITNPKDPAQIDAWLLWRSNQAGADPILKTPDGRNYYRTQILSNGGLTDTGYWTNKSTTAAYGGAVGAGETGGGNAINSQYLQPWTGEFNYPNFSYEGYQAPADFSYDKFGGFQDFKAPTGQDIANDPSYQFRLNQGEQALENSAAARGLLNSGGTLRDVLGLGQNMASQEYGNIWNRDFQSWNQGNQNALTDYSTNRGNAFDNWNANATKDLAGYTTNRANASDIWQKNYQNALTRYNDKENSFYRNQDGPYTKLSSLINTGAGAAGQV